MGSRYWKLRAPYCCAAVTISTTVIANRNGVSLNREIALPSAGTVLRIAWGRTTARHVRPAGSDSARAASHCPVGTASMPARYTSAM